MTGTNVTNKKILAVDDEKMLLMFMNDFLSSYGYLVTICVDTNEAIEMIKVDPDRFDVIITDQSMPEMTGLELVTQIRELSSSTPVILCSGYHDVMDENESNEHNISYYLQKPVDNSHLLKCLEQLTS
jgi:CheY-like chemotaxis protein